MSESEAIKRLYRNSFAAFARFADREVHPNVPCLPNWHDEVVADALEVCIETKCNRLIVNAPALCLNSVILAAAAALFTLAHHPTRKIVVLAGSRELASELRETANELMRSLRFREIFPHLRFRDSQRELRLQQGGQLRFAAIGGADIARSLDMVILVDPLSPTDASVERNRILLKAYYDAEILPRLGPSGVQIVLTPRLHRDDLVTHLLRSSESWTRVSLAAVAVIDETWPLSDGRVLTRKKGDVLHEKLQSRDSLIALLTNGGAINFAAQMQQQPLHTDSEYRTGFFMDPFDITNWTPEKGIPRKWAGNVPEVRYMLYELFGEGDPPPERSRPVLTLEQLEQAAILKQRRLIERVNRVEDERGPPECAQPPLALVLPRNAFETGEKCPKMTATR